MRGRGDKFRAIGQVRTSTRHAEQAHFRQGSGKKSVPPSLAIDKAGKLWAHGRVLRQGQVRLKHKHTLRWVGGLGVKIDIPDARCAVLRQPSVALSRGVLMERFGGGMRANQRGQLESRDAFILEQRK